jgi:hypothetical protein
MYIDRSSDTAFVEAIEAPTIVDGLAFGSIGAYKYCCTPHVLRQFVEKARRDLDMFDLQARGLLDFKRIG